MFLQVLDDGRLTDGQGRVVDFRNTVIIFTSNVGSTFLTEMGEGPVPGPIRKAVMSAIQSTWPPEFLNRIDNITIYVRKLLLICGTVTNYLYSVLSPRRIFARLSISVSAKFNNASMAARWSYL